MREQLYLDWVDCCLVDPRDQVKLVQISFHTEKENTLLNKGQKIIK